MKSEIISLNFPKVEDEKFNSFIKNELEEYLRSTYDSKVLVKSSCNFSLFMSHDISDDEWYKVRNEMLNRYNALMKHYNSLVKLIK